MRREVDENLLNESAFLALYPPKEFRGDVLADEGAWRYAIGRASEAERVALLVALGPDLLQVTPGAIERLQTHKAADVDPEPIIIGDAAFETEIKASLALVPPLVRFAVMREAAFLCVGRSCRAFVCSSQFVDITGLERTQVIVIGPDADEFTVLHEVAHVFTARVPHDLSQAITVVGERNGYALAAVQGWSHRIDTDQYVGEVLADALALAWLYSPTPTPIVS